MRSTNNYEQTIAIIGSGPAGIFLAIELAFYGYKVILFEGGHEIDIRDIIKKALAYVNGFGGAGLYSDRKLSTFPAGSKLLAYCNPHLLRYIFSKIINELYSYTNNDKFKELLDFTNIVLGDDTTSFEEIERKYKNIDYTQTKVYPSVVLENYDQAYSIIKKYQDELKDIVTYEKVIDITKSNEKYNIITDKNTFSFDYVILCMGRFGTLQMKKYSLFTDNDFDFMRFDYGIRVNTTGTLLNQKILQFKEINQCDDPKFKTTFKYNYNGRNINIEVRSFCVCIPTNGHGYMIKTFDTCNDIVSVSGSSSFDELTKRGNYEDVYTGSNLGIIIRIEDVELSSVFSQYMLDGRFNTIIEGDYSKELYQELYGDVLSDILDIGFKKLYFEIVGQELEENIHTLVPVIEGTGIYPKLNKQLFQLENHQNIFVSGDMVGHTRGLLQSMVMGSYVGNIVHTVCMEKKMNESPLPNPISLVNPIFGYNKVKMDHSYQRFKFPDMQQFITSNYNDWTEEYEKIKSTIFKVVSPRKIVYEIHHFFVDKNVYLVNGQLHYITQSALTCYIDTCNWIESNKDIIISNILDILDCDINYNDHKSIIDDSVNQTIKNYLFKACLLALRTRSSVETRDTYHDIPIMQSAVKFSPFDKNKLGDDLYNKLYNIEIELVSLFTSLLTTMFKNLNSEILLVRTKIETQENNVYPMISSSEALYYECHVKVNMKKQGQNIDYYLKKKYIHDLAGLVEGGDIFNVMAVSINLLKHPEHGQQFFLTFRTDTKEQMQDITKNFNKIMKQKIASVEEYNDMTFQFIPDSEFVVYDDNRPLDLPWFPISEKFLTANYKDFL